MTYDEVRADFEFLEDLADVEDMVEIDAGDRVLVRAKDTPYFVTPGKVVRAANRPGSFRVRFIDHGVVRSGDVPVGRLEKIEGFDLFYQQGVVAILEEHL